MLTSARYDAHADPDKVIFMCMWASGAIERTITNQQLRDGLAAAGKLGVELVVKP